MTTRGMVVLRSLADRGMAQTWLAKRVLAARLTQQRRVLLLAPVVFAFLTLPSLEAGPPRPSDRNTNQAFNEGTIRLVEPLRFVYSSHNEPTLLYNDGPSQGSSAIANAIKRGFRHVEESIQGLDHPDTKRTNLFTVTTTKRPIHPADATVCHGPLIDNNYPGMDFSGDGVNSIVWHTWSGPVSPEVNAFFAAITYTIWDESKAIVESDIVLTNSESMRWAIKEDLTRGGALDESPAIDIQAVATYMGLHVLGLRLVEDDGNPANGDETDATAWQPHCPNPTLPSRPGRYVLSNLGPCAHHPHGWQTLTPGDIQGAYEIAPAKGDRAAPTVRPEGPQLVLHYDFDAASIQGPTVLDRSGNHLDGRLVGGVTPAPGMRAGGLRFNGTGYVDLDGPSVPRSKIPVDGFTMAAWVNVDKASAPGPFTMLMEASSQLWQVDLPFGVVGHHWNLSPAFSILGNFHHGRAYAPNHASFPPVLVPDDWFHYASAYDGENLVVYFDGREVFRTSRSAATPCTDWSRYAVPLPNSWDEGARIGTNASPHLAPPSPFVGWMDDLALYNYALSASEVSALMNYGPAAVEPPQD